MIADINATIDIAASPARVWQVLTTEGLVAEWLGCLQFQARVGHVFYMQQDSARRAAGDTTGAVHCEVTALEEGRRMAFTWYYPETPKTQVELTLTPTATGARVTLVHTGWNQFDAAMIQGVRDGLAGGWTSFVLPQLRTVAERPA